MTSEIKHKILVLSGKGGVGKSTIAANLAVWLSLQNNNVGLLDIDIHGPSIPKLLGIEGKNIRAEGNTIEPFRYENHLKIMSIGFLLRNRSEAVIWRGPMKHNVIKQFIEKTDWGELDYLIVDCPPGTGDEPLSVNQILGKVDGAVIVTTPQQLAVSDVRKCLTFCKEINLPVLGIIENMSGFVCPHCNKKTDIFKGQGGTEMSQDFNVPFLGSIPLDGDMVLSGDLGKPFVHFGSDCLAAKALADAFENLVCKNEVNQNNNKETRKMRIAIPLTNGKLSQHFGHCEQFVIIDVDKDTKKINAEELVEPPAHEPGVLPKWLATMHVQVIIAGGMGQRAQQLFAQHNINVLCGAPQVKPGELINKYLDGQLVLGENICQH